MRLHAMVAFAFLVTLSVALAVPRAAFQRLEPTGADAAPALQAAAHALFRAPRGTLFHIERTDRRAENETYSVASDDAGPLGTFVRFRAAPGPECTVDLALRLEDGAVKAAAPVRPLILQGAAFPALPAALAQAPDVPVSMWAPAMAAFFRALADVDAVLSGSAAPAAPDEAEAKGALEEL